jgi:hypothetical protein
MVLATWRRILEGDEDVGGEFTDGETEVRKYLSKIKDRKLVVENGTWLARRNPKIGVQVFADESSRVVIPPNEALAILRDSAPNAVKDYLEYLVFGKMVREPTDPVVLTNLATATHQRVDCVLSRHCSLGAEGHVVFAGYAVGDIPNVSSSAASQANLSAVYN